MNATHCVPAVAIGMALLTGSARAQTFQALGRLAGSSGECHAYSVSADGSVVAGTSPSAAHNLEAYRWTSATGMVGLGVIPGTSAHSYGNAVSGDGSVVAGDGLASDGGPYVGMRWTSATGMRSIGNISGTTQPGQFLSRALALNGDGSVAVGWSITSSPGVNRAFRYTPGLPMQDLGSLISGGSSQGMAVNSSGGAVVGWSSVSAGNQHAFRWTAAAGMQDLGVLAPDTYSGADAISGDGTVIVGTCATPFQVPIHPFRWTSGTGMVPLTQFPGSSSSWPHALNQDGSVIVGQSQLSGGHAIVWARGWGSAAGVVDLNIYLPSVGVDLTGWTLTTANAVSADGYTIVGDGNHVGSGIEGWIATLPRCGSADFNHDGDTATDADIEAFFRCLAGNCCATCGTADFNGDGDTATDADIEAFFRVLAGGSC